MGTLFKHKTSLTHSPISLPTQFPPLKMADQEDHLSKTPEAEAEADAVPQVEEVVVAPQSHNNVPQKPPSQSLRQLVQSHDKDPPPVPEPEPEPQSDHADDDTATATATAEEETTNVDLQHKALLDLKLLVREALQFTTPNNSPTPQTHQPEQPKPQPQIQVPPEQHKVGSESLALEDDGAKTVEAIEETIVAVADSKTEQDQETEQQQSKLSAPAEQQKPKSEQVAIWGIPLMADERTDTILLKFLRAREFKVKEAFAMLKNTIRWRQEFGIDDLVLSEEDEDEDLNKVVFMHGSDKEGHPVCYNVYGEFQNKELYQKTFSDEEKRLKFLRWRIRFLEKSIRKLDFSPGGSGPCTIFQVNDLKNSPGPGKWELRQATKQGLQLLQDNYPEFVAKQVFINVPWWYLAVNRMISPFLTQRTKSKFVFAGPSKSAETLFRYIAAEQVPVKYGGLSKIGDFDTFDAVTEITLKPAAEHSVEFPVTHESCVVSWEVRVVGWEASYGAEFVPNAEDSYTVIIQKRRKLGSNEEQAEPVVCDSFKAAQPGKVVITFHNPTSKKKKLLYRFKTKPFIN